MRLKIESDVSGVTQAFDLLIDGMKDLKPILKRFGAVVRKEVQAVFESEGPGWKALEESTEQHRATLASATKERIQRRAEQRLSGTLRKDYRRAADRFLQGKENRSALLYRKHVMNEFDRITIEGGSFEETTSSRSRSKASRVGWIGR